METDTALARDILMESAMESKSRFGYGEILTGYMDYGGGESHDCCNVYGTNCRRNLTNQQFGDGCGSGSSDYDGFSFGFGEGDGEGLEDGRGCCS